MKMGRRIWRLWMNWMILWGKWRSIKYGNGRDKTEKLEKKKIDMEVRYFRGKVWTLEELNVKEASGGWWEANRVFAPILLLALTNKTQPQLFSSRFSSLSILNFFHPSKRKCVCGWEIVLNLKILQTYLQTSKRHMHGVTDMLIQGVFVYGRMSKYPQFTLSLCFFFYCLVYCFQFRVVEL